MTHDRTVLKIGLAVIGLWVMALLAPQPLAAASPKLDHNQIREYTRRGLDLLMNGDPDAAIAFFRQIQAHDPQSALGYLLEADATWWKIYYATADLAAPDVFDVVSSETTPYDLYFERLVKEAIGKAEAHRQAHEDEARNYLYEGLAYALRARLVGLRGKDLPTARAGKKMRWLMLRALQLDPSLTDAYLGVGLYNYFVDTLPTIVKILRIFIGLPGGDSEVGLQQLQQAAEKGELARGEAKFLLAKDYSRQNERQYSTSLKFFQELEREYPGNPFWTLLIGSVQCRLNNTRECESLYRQVIRQTAEEKIEARQAVHRAAVTALERLRAQAKQDNSTE